MSNETCPRIRVVIDLSPEEREMLDQMIADRNTVASRPAQEQGRAIINNALRVLQWLALQRRQDPNAKLFESRPHPPLTASYTPPPILDEAPF